jgi:hypothetical protein
VQTLKNATNLAGTTTTSAVLEVVVPVYRGVNVQADAKLFVVSPFRAVKRAKPVRRHHVSGGATPVKRAG